MSRQRYVFCLVVIGMLRFSPHAFADAQAPPLPDSEVTLLHADAVGTVRARTVDGQLEDIETPGPFGEAREAATRTDPGTPGFAGKPRDATSGLDDFSARDYASALGRFTSIDPASFRSKGPQPQDYNLYSYGRNNPFMFVDPDGRAAQPITTIGGITVYRATTKEDLLSVITDPRDVELAGASDLTPSVPSEEYISQAIQDLTCRVMSSPLARRIVSHPGTIVFLGAETFNEMVGAEGIAGVTGFGNISFVRAGEMGPHPPGDVTLHEIVHQAITPAFFGDQAIEDLDPDSYPFALAEVMTLSVTDAMITGRTRPWWKVVNDMYGDSAFDTASSLGWDRAFQGYSARQVGREATRVIKFLELQ